VTINQNSSIRILSLVEATTINGVAKNVFEFHRAARELNEQSPDFPSIAAHLVTFERKRPATDATRAPNQFVSAAGKLKLEVEVVPERRRFDMRTLAALRKIVGIQKPDLVVTHSVKSHFLMWRSRLWKDYPWVAFHHGYTTTDLKMRAYNWLDRWSLPHADRLVTVCQAFARELASSNGVPLEKISVQHNSVRPKAKADAADVQSLKTRLGIGNDERFVLTVGRLSREKAHIDLLAAYNLLRDTNPDILSKLIIVGDGPERGRLEASARAYGINDRVIFTGQMSDVQPFYAAADVLVLPSLSEGSPYVLLEAMAANLPVVATAVGGVPEMVENNNSALLVPARDKHAMAAAITRVLTDEEMARRLTTHAFAMVGTRYSPAAYASSLIEIYRGVLRSRLRKSNRSNSALTLSRGL
jgi:glycosyltransferase involved in cell wall biosynthesis